MKLPNTINTKELIINDCLKPLLKLVIDNNGGFKCNDIKDKISLFDFISCSILKDNSSYVCFENLKKMYFRDEIPINMFWISSVNSVSDEIIIPPNNFQQDIDIIIKTIIENKFELNNEWYFKNESNEGVFLNFNKSHCELNYFITIFIAFKNIEGLPTLDGIRNKSI
jgi:hypothetical protein